LSKKVIPRSQNFSGWYTDVITKAGLADYGPVKGTMVIKPYGFSLWENLRDSLDKMIKDSGHVNAYFPLFIPKSFLAQEAEHVEGFAKECAVVTHSRLKAGKDGLIVDPESKLDEEVIVRPTSETVIWSMYKKWIQSYRDLPLLINQWANVVRWEMRTRLFLRTTEFLWQEGHTAHATEEEAEKETLLILSIYKKLAEEFLAVPVLTGLKSEAEKFAGAERTYCIEAMMGDKRALQAGTSHNLGQNFAKAFGVTFQTEDNKEKYVHATSWGVSTRLLGAVIMTHGDDKGLRLPPKIAPYQIVIVPIFRTDEDRQNIHHFLEPALNKFKNNGVRYYEDWSPNSPGFKFNEWEMKGVPIRLEVGPRDVNESNVILARRDTGEKKSYSINGIFSKVSELLEEIQNNLFQQALTFRENHTHSTDSYEEFKSLIKEKGGFIKCGWDGESETELRIKEETKATVRCILSDGEISKKMCVYSGKPAKYEVIFAKAY
tara:strand:+ start:181454 stop:182920 length:1467 start_codon:yes stop_codon:yes gene_type:complete